MCIPSIHLAAYTRPDDVFPLFSTIFLQIPVCSRLLSRLDDNPEIGTRATDTVVPFPFGRCMYLSDQNEKEKKKKTPHLRYSSIEIVANGMYGQW